jgi:hypothetical protein
VKRCSKCGLDKAEVEFYRNRTKPDGLVQYCKTCYGPMVREYNRRFRCNHRERYLLQKREETKRRRSKPENKEYERVRSAMRRENSEHRLRLAIGCRIYQTLISGKGGKSWPLLVGYTVDDLRSHLEARFLPGMTWENYGNRNGQWSIDHIIPVSAFNISSYDDEDFRRCWSLSNLQPLWVEDNIRKRDKLPADFQPALALGA